MKLLRGIVIVLLLVIAAFADAAAQSRIREIRIRPDVFDLTASTSQRLDMNGNPCGLLKVSVQVDNVEFQGNIIGDVVRHGGDYWVYVTNGTKKIRMTSAAFGGVDLLFADWDIPHIQSKTTYNVTVELSEPAASVSVVQSGINSTSGPDMPHFSTKPINMALCAKGPDGYVYITADQWKNLPESQKSSFNPLGVYLAPGNFLVELHDKENGKEMSWYAAMKYNLPSKKQGQALVDNYTALNNALRAFGGTIMNDYYWTKTEDGSSSAWYVAMYGGFVFGNGKAATYRVRAVAPVPEFSAR